MNSLTQPLLSPLVFFCLTGACSVGDDFLAGTVMIQRIGSGLPRELPPTNVSNEHIEPKSYAVPQLPVVLAVGAQGAAARFGGGTDEAAVSTSDRANEAMVTNSPSTHFSLIFLALLALMIVLIGTHFLPKEKTPPLGSVDSASPSSSSGSNIDGTHAVHVPVSREPSSLRVLGQNAAKVDADVDAVFRPRLPGHQASSEGRQRSVD
eukprot:TRINITY_DN17271_c0_g1_i1.p1 TRINITY_DN17271_c0_g1~~TRINITY_DN17271_c0_g1_i1.p1  ORF type:complete len:222 (-),score=26.35 TRINITY_DN17271_c0_g1_i1:65-685(-)